MGTMESDIFKEEAYDLLDDIEATLLELKAAPADRELINRLFRAFHTIKGSGAMFGFKAVAAFTHELETAIDEIRDGTGVFPDELTEVLLAGRDQILRMIEAPDPSDPEIQQGAAAVLGQLHGTTESAPAAVPAAAQQPPPTPAPQPAQSTVAAPPPQKPSSPQPPTPENQALIDELDELLDEVRQILRRLREQPKSAKMLKKLHRALHTVSGTATMYDMTPLADFSAPFAATVESVKESEKPAGEALLNALDTALGHCFFLLKSQDSSASPLARRSEKILADLAAALPGAQPTGATAAEPLRALIVEDEFISRYLLQEFLTPYGSSHVAIDGYEAILAFKNALIEKKPYQLVCLDIMMPGIDGRQVAKEIRRLETEMGGGIASKVVMTTAIADPRVKDELLAAGHCDAYLVKPLRFEDLTELIETYFPALPTAER